ncbi:MAG: tRNA glutamyl-Q(34) synthetase GluQRS [Phycisphaerales bacterium]
MARPTTRLAPSPTGALHLGNARTFLVNWALARRAGWRVVLRIEDLDTPRVKPGVIDQTIETLRWLGLDWDEQAPLQSADLSPYRNAMRTLAKQGLAYPCRMTRREVAAAASAPHADEREARFPSHLRPATRPDSFDHADTSWRFVVPEGPVAFDDLVRGRCAPDPSETVGDFPVWTVRDQPSYQLAVVVDDARQGITHVVRGDDLVDSAGRQLLLYRALGIAGEPVYAHLPLVRGSDGRRLAKRHGDSRIDAYRRAGVPAERLIALLARWSGIADAGDSCTAEQFAQRFALDTMPTADVVFTPENDAWLRR